MGSGVEIFTHSELTDLGISVRLSSTVMWKTIHNKM